ncbi:hypothetical protein DID78_01355 [Candidatus Marinamargulisbacteria bacterium SCGC AG-343-D04]|nr:hypothetical protein DID78_01355 [Candidatus Marinamargulisbacteria bacterium SCGC AG-343-D04]
MVTPGSGRMGNGRQPSSVVEPKTTFFNLTPFSPKSRFQVVDQLMPHLQEKYKIISHPPLTALRGGHFFSPKSFSAGGLDFEEQDEDVRSMMKTMNTMSDFDEDVDFCGQRDHINEGRCYIMCCAANTPTGPTLQRYMVIASDNYRASRQLGGVYFNSELGLREVQIKTDGQYLSQNFKLPYIIRRFIKGVDLGCVDEETLKSLAAKMGSDSIIKNLTGMLMMGTLDQFNPSNLLVVDPSSQDKSSPIKSFDFELAFPNANIVQFFRENSPAFNAKYPNASDGVPFSFDWRRNQVAKYGFKPFVEQQFGTTNPWFMLLDSLFDSPEEALSCKLPKGFIESILKKEADLDSIIKDFTIYSQRELEESTYRKYMSFFREGIEKKQEITVAELIGASFESKSGDVEDSQGLVSLEALSKFSTGIKIGSFDEEPEEMQVEQSCR